MYQVAFVGIDGAGKTTIIEEVHDKLLNSNIQSYRLKGKGDNIDFVNNLDTFMDEYSEKTLKCYAYFFDLIKKISKLYSSKQVGDIVLWDRHIPCFYAYYTAWGLDIEKFKFYLENGRDILYIYLDVDLEVAVQRIEKRGEKVSQEDITYLNRVRNEYDMLCDYFHMIRVDANRSIEQIVKDILQILKEYVGREIL